MTAGARWVLLERGTRSLAVLWAIAVAAHPPTTHQVVSAMAPQASRAVPDNPCDVLTVAQVGAASGVTVLTARRVPSITEEVRANQTGAAPPAGSVCTYETTSDFGAISVAVVRGSEATPAKYREARDWYFQSFPGSAWNEPGLGLDAWGKAFTYLHVLVRDDLQVVVTIQTFPAGTRGSPELLVAVARAAVRSLESGRSPQPDRRLLSIPTPDNGTVAADEYGTGDRGVVLAHGGRFDKASWAIQARTLADAGFRVLAIDFRAAVESRAGRESACLYDEKCLAVDVLAAVRYLRRTGARTVAVIGASLGGGAAAQAAVEAADAEIDGVVLLAHMAIATPDKMKGRKLFIVARGDLGPGDQPRLPGIREQYDKAPGPKELVVLEGSAHAQFIFDTPEGVRLMREILRFLGPTVRRFSSPRSPSPGSDLHYN